MYPVTITSQGQISLPVEARKKVGMKPGDRLFVTPVGGKLELVKDEGIKSLRGSLKEYGKGKPILTRARLEKLREQMYTERYRRYLKQDGQDNS